MREDLRLRACVCLRSLVVCVCVCVSAVLVCTCVSLFWFVCVLEIDNYPKNYNL